MHVIFLGYAVSRNEAGHLKGTSVAGNKMQLNLLEHLNRYPDVRLNIVTLYPVPAYPKDKTIFFRRRTIELSDRLNAACVSFLNFPAVKQVWQMLSLYGEAGKLLKSHPGSVVLTYNLYAQIGAPLDWLKKRYRCKAVTLLADPPIDPARRKWISRFFRYFYYRKAKRCLRTAENLIVLNRQTARQYSPDANYIVVDGGIEPKEYPQREIVKSAEKNIVYSGALTEYNGICELLDAMRKVKNQEVKLHLYGSGPLEELVRQRCGRESNIEYFGSVGNGLMLQKQSEAFLLINPRRTDDPVSRLTFPSKIFEYMMSGTPVLTTKLNGFSPDYYDKMFFVDRCDSDLIAKKIDEIAGLDQESLAAMARRAKKFVLEHKTWERQTKRIYEFIKAQCKGRPEEIGS